MKTIATEFLETVYRDEGPADGSPLLLLHGWPDDASTWDKVAPGLNEAGFRTITPMHRGFGQTRFRSDTTARSGDTAILAMDAIALLDALGLETVSVAGHDWGSNMAEALAVGWPARIKRIAMLSTPPRLGGMPTPPFAQVRRQWYHWFQATARGAEAVHNDRKGFARIMWETWSPEGWFDEPTFRAVAASFENPDWPAVTIHSYRSRWGEADPDPRSRWLSDKVRETETLGIPMLFIQGDADGVNPPETSENIARKFTGPFKRIILPGIGHFPTREAAPEVTQALIAHFTA